MKVNSYVSIECTWDDLKTAITEGTDKELIHSGDTIPVELKNGEKVLFDVARDESGKVFFVLHDCLDDERSMNSRNTNKGGWRDSVMRKYLNKTIYSLLPDDLQAAIAPTKIVQTIEGEQVETEDKLFLLSYTQVFGKSRYFDEPEDTQLDIFKTERGRVKECADHGTWWWWLRSPASSASTTFMHVGNGGGSGSNFAGNSFGVAFGFCLI